MCSGDDFLELVTKTLDLHTLKNADSTLLNDYVVRVYFDDCVLSEKVEEFKKKIAHCCDVDMYNCHIVDIIKKEPFTYL